MSGVIKIWRLLGIVVNTAELWIHDCFAQSSCSLNTSCKAVRDFDDYVACAAVDFDNVVSSNVIANFDINITCTRPG